MTKRSGKKSSKQLTCVIITALRVEALAIRAFVRDLQDQTDDAGVVFERGTYESHSQSWRIVLCTAGKGNTRAAVITTKAIELFAPNLVMFVGVAGGLKDVAIGDVVVADKVYEYASGKETETGFQPRPDVKTPPFRLVQQAQAVARDSAWLGKLPTGKVNSARAHVGPIAAGEVVIASSKTSLYQQLRMTYSDALAVEMEGSGVLAAAYVSDQPALIVRGISDLLDAKDISDAEGSQELASRNASLFAIALLDRLSSDMQPTRARRMPEAPVKAATRRPSRLFPEGGVQSSHLYRSTLAGSDGVVTEVRGSLDEAALEDFVDSTEWIVGAVNFDEDLHFSSFYTRQSCAPYQKGDLLELGYTGLVALYEDFRETYYVPKAECLRVANAILTRITENPMWMQGLLDEIYIRSKALEGVFSDELLPFDRLSDDELLRIYHLHNEAHSRLYEVSRIPEAMDRGIAVFTAYLRDYLRKRGASLASSAKELNRVFEILTFPEEMSEVRRELGEFHEIIQTIRKLTEGLNLTAVGGRRAWLKMPPVLRGKIESHRKKWGYLGYHGYGTRTIADIDHYLQRISTALTRGDEALPSTEDYARLLGEAESRRVSEFTRHRIDEAHQMLFRMHSRIGIAKLYRRYFQLRNFAFLDQLLSDVSRRKSCPEEVVRCLLPEEIEVVLATGQSIPSEMRLRTDFAVHVIQGNAEAVFGGPHFTQIRDRISLSLRAAATSAARLDGTVAQTGMARGLCKIIVRPADAERVRFQKGDILVSEATDPDLVDLMRIASGVVTEAGGVTSHAAIVCRELGKPALIGVANLLDNVQNDDYAVLNAEDGYLSILRWDKRHWTVPDSAVSEHEAVRLGSKAANLARMVRAGFRVPRFFVVPLDRIAAEIRTTVTDATGDQWEALSTEIITALGYLSGDLFMVRTSVVGEDDPIQSHAGEFETDSQVERQDVVGRVVRQVHGMSGLNAEHPSGAIIVQEMVLGDYSGVCFTRDPTSAEGDRMLVEAVPGGNDALTSGQVVPARYWLDCETDQVNRDEGSRNWQTVVPTQMWSKLSELFRSIEKLFGSPQDIEWTAKGGEVWLLQSRPITVIGGIHPSDGATLRRRTFASGPRDIGSIYAAFRVPPNLRLHMLRVAGVAALISEKWNGPSIDRQAVLTTCLVHDIGNIAKANYDAFPTLFPEEMQHLEYWKAVQTNLRGRYGADDQQVTLAIAQELGLSDRILQLLVAKTFLRNKETSVCDDWDLKICVYADQRVSPSGVLPLADRLSEARERYRGVPFASVNSPEYWDLAECARQIELQVIGQTTIQPDQISDQTIESWVQALRSFNL
jgi:nucleoside phosphorylase/phosphohistidine swiveling domain-containing protein